MSAPAVSRLAGVLAGQRGSLARAITAVENETTAGALLAAELRPHCGRAQVLGITGAPGAGKSTLINALLGAFLAAGRRVAVVAVDPSSPVSGGAVLGDRVRMGQHAGDERVFIRSLSARGHLGGVSRTTGRIIDVLDAGGFDLVIVETVGAGQSEVEIQHLADTSIVVCPPGLGDDVQAIKAGILEIADILVVNKGDSPLAERTLRDLRDMLHLRRPSAWTVPVLRTVATAGEGITELVERIHAHAAATGLGKRLRPAAEDHAGHADPARDESLAAVEFALRSRRSVRRFLPTAVPRSTIEAILAAASHAPSGSNTQPWQVHVLAGEALRTLSAKILEADANAPETHVDERPFYPPAWPPACDERRRALARSLYTLLGIDRDDRRGRREFWRRNYAFFDAPVGLVFTIDRHLEYASWLDYGIFLGQLMTAARARGLDSCAQGAFRRYHRCIAEALGLADDVAIVCGMSLGHADPAAPVNRLSTPREPVAGFARFHGFAESPP